MAFSNSMVIELGNKLSSAIDKGDCIRILVETSRIDGISKDWKGMLIKLSDYFKDGNLKNTHYSIFTKGNSKLPFYSYSELSLATCPGKDKCADYCYSKKGWRYPDVVGRQVQNMLLMRFNPEIIGYSFNILPKDITLRLYVDGDFANAKVVSNWFNALANRTDVRAYGYSKSWDEIYSVKSIWPINYTLNLSNGGLERSVKRADMESLPGVRGSFLAVSIDPTLMTKSKKFSLEYHMAVRDSIKSITGHAGFSCPGLCGSCNVKGQHACNSPILKGIAIGIGIH